MTSKTKKFRCINCGKTFEITITAEDPIRCPYCGAGPGVLIRIYEEKTAPQTPIPQTPIQTPPNQPQSLPPQTYPNAQIPMKRFMCYNCNRVIEVPYGVPKPVQCPHCGAPAYMIHRIDKGPGRRGFGRPFW